MKAVRISIIIILLYTESLAQSFNGTYSLIQGKNYFKAKTQYYENKNNYTTIEQTIIEAFLFNAFNNPTKSNKFIKKLCQKPICVHDTIMLELLNVQTDNYIKLYKYKEAKKTIEKPLTNYEKYLSEKESKDLNNVLKIWTTFENEAAQKIKTNNQKPLKLKTDKAGLKNLETRIKEDTVSFIFDTGANISTVSLTTAKKFGMKIFPVSIEVGTITGKETMAQLALCPVMHIGKIEIKNAIFLVFNNESLFIKELDHQINGILGFPVIEALEEIKISKKDFFQRRKKQRKRKKRI